MTSDQFDGNRGGQYLAHACRPNQVAEEAQAAVPA